MRAFPLPEELYLNRSLGGGSPQNRTASSCILKAGGRWRFRRPGGCCAGGPSYINDGFCASASSASDKAPVRVHLHISWTSMHKACILVHMRSTLNLDDELIEKARRLTGIDEKTALIRAGLEALIARETARRLAALGGTQPHFQAGPRKRSGRTGIRSRS